MDKHLQMGRIGVLMGGYSSEREISLKSGQAVFEALQRCGCQVTALDILDRDVTKISEFIKHAALDVAFIALHGRLGEDGTIQSILGDLNIPFTGSSKEASGRAINKVITQDLLQKSGIPVAVSFGVTDKDSLSFIETKIAHFPVVIKPACEGSSIGVTLVQNTGQLRHSLPQAFQYGPQVLIEQYIQGRELSIGILDQKALPIIEICAKAGFFDFNAKYKSGTTEYILPASLSEDMAAKIQTTALRAHKILGCCDLSRVDLMLDHQGHYYVLEINTIPGFTSVSLLPKAAKSIGITFEQLCLKLVELAYGKTKETRSSAFRS